MQALCLLARAALPRTLRAQPVQAGPDAFGQRAKVAVATVGKIKTVVQMVALGFLLYREPLLGLPIFQIGEWLLAAAAILTLWSGFEYARAAWPALRAQEHAVAVQQGVDTPK